MEYKYYRELRHNYLVAGNTALDHSNKDSYQVRILKTGNLKGFVPCDVRTINNEYFLYYEINSLQSIKDRFATRGMNTEQLLKLFSCLKEALLGLSEYLLGIENVVLDAGSVFTDLNTGDFYFLYCPFQDKAVGFSTFADELFELVDHEDEKAVEIVYSCSEKAQEEGALVLELIEQLIKDDYENETKPEKKTIEFMSEPQESSMDVFEEEDPIIEDEEKDTLPAKRLQNISGKINGKVQIMFSLLFFVLVATMVAIRMNYILTEEENMLSIAVMLVSMVTGIVSFLSGIRDLLAKSAKDSTEEKELPEEEEFFQEDHTWDETAEAADPIDMSAYKNPISVGSAMKGGDETILLDAGEEEDRDITLYSRNTDKTLRISLGKLPLTVGKLQGCVDNVINDKSVSRIHCRFSKDPDGRIILRDLNSTNGTFRNGLRLNPQEDIFIEEGDEVRIGRICFDCR